MTVLQAAAELRAKKLSVHELVQESLDRIARLDGRVNAFITVMAQSALARARRLDEELAAGVDRGPLHGIPVALKDVFSTRGVRTTCGSRIFADYVPDHDAAVVERLTGAGAVIVGKTNMHELAYGITSVNPHYGAVRNPRDPERVAGGSSGGSATAVAAGMVFLAMGTDTGGSIRIPASFCGVVGLKPTHGRVSRYGVLPLDFSLDHMGPLARSARDAALALEAIAGHDPRDPSCSRKPAPRYVPGAQLRLDGLRIGIPQDNLLEGADAEVIAALRAASRAAEALGAGLVQVKLPDIDQVNAIGRLILLAEAAAIFEKDQSRRADFGADVRALLDQGRLIPATDYVNAQRLRREKCREFAAVWREVDCLFTPATPLPAPKIEETTVELGGRRVDVRLAATRFVRPFNVLGLPALSMPCGSSSRGLPLGLQIAGRSFDEATVLRVSAALEDHGI
ncbi:MAG: amidase [Bryobacterales bacterium]|nr:amidase [Bryobacterales bacterium]